jgi:DNA polymerase-3 subunit chi
MSDAPEALFYHLTRRPLEAVTPEILERCLARGWRVTLRGGSPERIATLSAHLWTYRDDSFLPHGDAADGHAERQPVYLTAGPEKPNNPDVLLLVDRAAVDPAELTAHRRVATLFDGHDETAVAEARVLWKQAIAAGCRAQYWAEENGRFVLKAGER